MMELVIIFEIVFCKQYQIPLLPWHDVLSVLSMSCNNSNVQSSLNHNLINQMKLKARSDDPFNSKQKQQSYHVIEFINQI